MAAPAPFHEIGSSFIFYKHILHNCSVCKKIINFHSPNHAIMYSKSSIAAWHLRCFIYLRGLMANRRHLASLVIEYELTFRNVEK